MLGVDYSYSRPNPTKLYQAKVRFVVRYLSYNSEKNLTKAEVTRLKKAGLDIVSNWENKAGDQRGGRSAGIEHAKAAWKQHLACGGPADRPVYFSVDWDATTTELKTCFEYLKGCIDTLGWQRVGVYGGYRTIDFMADRGIRWLWQTYAWSGGRWDSRTHLQQYSNNKSLAGGLVDYNRSMQADFGQWSKTGSLDAALHTSA